MGVNDVNTEVEGRGCGLYRGGRPTIERGGGTM